MFLILTAVLYLLSDINDKISITVTSAWTVDNSTTGQSRFLRATVTFYEYPLVSGGGKS